MNKIFNKYAPYIKIFLLTVCLVSVMAFRDTALLINQKVENGFYAVKGQEQPDTSVVIIHIDQADIDNLGPWPLKRSYYALLISQLTSLDVKAIGLEVFLSGKFASQSIYSELLNGTIKESGRVVLASVAEDTPGESRTLLMPEPKTAFPEIPTGHINYNDEHGFYIPLSITPLSGGSAEKAFSLALAEKSGFKGQKQGLIKINFVSSWKKFRNYSLLQFFNLFESGSSEVKSLKGKTVIIGVSDPQTGQMLASPFDRSMPGVALHAFALDNLLNFRSLNTRMYYFSTGIFALLLIGLIFFSSRKEPFYVYMLLFVSFVSASFMLFGFFNVELNYSAFLMPFFFLTLFESFISVARQKMYLSGIISESEKLKKILEEKELHLQKLQRELNITGEGSGQAIVEKISALKQEIDDLKFKQQDDTPLQQEEAAEKAENFFGIVYKSRVMASAVSLIKKVAPEDATVLISGESGTGKELAARSMHLLNKRKDKNFVAVNCAALSDTLLESELFGHVKGAFTNAVADKTGRFEAADKGTIFLDEIGETSENFQVKLLRVLQTGEFEKVGSSKTIKTDVRVIAATNKNLEALVREKKFREDLFYRLNVISIKLPSLRERKEDIEVIANYFLSSGDEKMELSLSAMQKLKEYEWKGNVRELESAIKRGVIFAKAAGRKMVKLMDLPPEIAGRDKSNLDKMILESLREKKFSHSSINETAKELGDLSRTIVSENFRGMAFRAYVESDYDMEKAVTGLADTDDEKVKEKLRSKITTFLKNIETDVNELKPAEFEEVRVRLNSKYKNLPQKYHAYLDDIIKRVLKEN